MGLATRLGAGKGRKNGTVKALMPSCYTGRQEGIRANLQGIDGRRQMQSAFPLVHWLRDGTVLSSRMRHDAQGLDTLVLLPAADLRSGEGRPVRSRLITSHGQNGSRDSNVICFIDH